MITCDNGGEFIAPESSTLTKSKPAPFEKVCAANDIRIRATSPYTPAMNGISERMNRVLSEAASSMLQAASLKSNLWSLAVRYALQIYNRTPHQALEMKSPYQLLFNRAPLWQPFKTFGCDAFKFIHDRKKGGFTPKATSMIFVGLSDERKGWLLLDKRTRKLSTSFHVQFDECFKRRRDELTMHKLNLKSQVLTDKQREAMRFTGELFSDEFEGKPFGGLYPSGSSATSSSVPSTDPSWGTSKARPRPVELAAQRKAARTVNPAPPSGEGGGRESGSSHQSSRDSAELEGAQHPKGGSTEGTADSDDSSDDEPTPISSRLRKKADHNDINVQKSSSNGGNNVDMFNDLNTLAMDLLPPNVDPLKKVIAPNGPDVRRFVKFALDNDWPIQLMQNNPKEHDSASRRRYEGYKLARTLVEFISLGGTMGDVMNDRARGYLHFLPLERHRTTIGEMIESTKLKHQQLQPHDYVTSLEDYVRREYCVLAVQHIDSLPSHSKRNLLKSLGGNLSMMEFAHCCAARVIFEDPLTVEEAMASPLKDKWIEAMDEEIRNLNSFGCFLEVTKADALRQGKLVRSKWVFKVKYDKDGSVQRCKARLVAKGFTQQEGKDYFETYSPVFSYSSLRLLLARATERDQKITQWDIKSAFIQQDLDVDHLYMECPKGYPNTFPDGTPKALKCVKSIYGMVQSSRLLHQRLSKWLTSKLGFTQLISDSCVYRKGTGDDEIIVCTWVDDLVMFSSNKVRDPDNDMCKWFNEELNKEFVMSPWTQGESGWLLNMKIERDWVNGVLHLSQEQAIDKLAAKFGVDSDRSNRPSIPMRADLKLRKPEPKDIVPKSTFDYQGCVGSLLYLVLTCRPECAYAVGVLSRFMSCPSLEHVQAAKHLLGYLYKTKDWGIRYSRGKPTNGIDAPHDREVIQTYVSSQSPDDHDSSSKAVVTRGTNVINADSGQCPTTYVDADLAGDFDTLRSTTGTVIMYHGGAITWIAKLQTTVALSTTEAETIAATEATKEIMSLRMMLEELNEPQVYPTLLFEDNAACKMVVDSDDNGKKTRYYKMRVHFLRQQRREGVIYMEKVATDQQLADLFTKPLPQPLFQKYRDWLGLLPPIAAQE